MFGSCLLLFSFCEAYIIECFSLLLLPLYFGFCKNTKSFSFLQIIVLQYSIEGYGFKRRHRLDASFVQLQESHALIVIIGKPLAFCEFMPIVTTSGWAGTVLQLSCAITSPETCFWLNGWHLCTTFCALIDSFICTHNFIADKIPSDLGF